MTEQNQNPVPARVHKNKTSISIVWLVPLIALIAGSWLLMKSIRNTGPEVTLLMASADGIEVNNTVIKVLSVEVGRVTKIRLREDRKGVEVSAQLNADARDLIRKDTQFWVVKPRIDQSGITGLNTLVSGSYIAFTPGSGEEKADTFIVSDLPPIAAIGQTGLRLKLIGKNSKMIAPGSPVMYEDFIVGQVESAEFNPNKQIVEYNIFVQSPNHELINKGSQFWLESGIKISTGGSGINIDSPPLSALLSGAIAFSSPQAQAGEHAVNDEQFTLYNSRNEINDLPGDRSIYYTAFFNGSIGGLVAGSPVEYKGIKVGSVADAPYFERNDSLKLFQNGWIPVRIRIEPDQMEINAERQSREHWQNQFQIALNKGLNATISSNNLITGSKMIDLSDAPNNGKPLKPFSVYAGYTVIPTRAGGLDNLQAQLGDLLAKLNKLPLEKTVGELNGSLAELKATLNSANRLLGAQKTQQIPQELNKTLAELRQTLQGVSPQSPLYGDIQSTLQSIDQTLREAKPVLNTLKEQPNALIFNRSQTDPTPKGSR